VLPRNHHQGFSNYFSYGLSTLDFIQLAAQQTVSVRHSTKARGIISSRCVQATRKKLSPGHLLPQEPALVFSLMALPGTLRIAEVDPNRSRAGETIWDGEVSDEDYSVASFRGQD
jgi:hypothetical protein